MKLTFFYRFLLVICFSLLGFFASAQTVYVSSSGKKYHAKNCSIVKTGKKGIDLKTAVKEGYQPCKICKIEDIIAAEEKQKAKKDSLKKAK